MARLEREATDARLQREKKAAARRVAKEAAARRQRERQAAEARRQREAAATETRQQQEQEAVTQEGEGQGDKAQLLVAAIALSLSAERLPPLDDFLDQRAPDYLICTILTSLLEDPVLLMGDGCTYSRAAIQEHLDFCRNST